MTFIYILKLKNDKYYIGKSNTPFQRIQTHFEGNGSSWTKKYPPKEIYQVIPECDDYDENKYTQIYMDKYGIENVRGGSYVQIKLSASSVDQLNKSSAGNENKCFKCGKTGHFANKCNESESESDYEEELDLDTLKFSFIKKCKKENSST